MEQSLRFPVIPDTIYLSLIPRVLYCYYQYLRYIEELCALDWELVLFLCHVLDSCCLGVVGVLVLLCFESQGAGMGGLFPGGLQF